MEKSYEGAANHPSTEVYLVSKSQLNTPLTAVVDDEHMEMNNVDDLAMGVTADKPTVAHSKLASVTNKEGPGKVHKKGGRDGHVR